MTCTMPCFQATRRLTTLLATCIQWFTVPLLIVLGAPGLLEAQNYNPNNFDTALIMQEIQHPHKDLITISSHRGLHALVDGSYKAVPENSLQALGLAAQAGLEMIELDVKLTSDGVPILSHDSTWGRETCTYLGGSIGDGVSFDPFQAQGSNSTNDAKNLLVANTSLARTRYYYFDNFVLRDTISINNGNNGFYSHGCSNTGHSVFSAVFPPTLQDALNYMTNNKIAMVLALDLRDAPTAAAAWAVIGSNSDYLGRNYAASTLFKIPGKAFINPKASPANFADTSVFKSTFSASPGYSAVHFQPVYNTGDIAANLYANENNIITQLRAFQTDSTIDVSAIEIQYKQSAGILLNVISAARTSPTTGNPVTESVFSPYVDYYYPGDTTKTPMFFATNSYCCVPLSDFYYNTPKIPDPTKPISPNPATPPPSITNAQYDKLRPSDSADNRGSLAFVVGTGYNSVTRDDATAFALKLNADGKRNISYMQSKATVSSNTVAVSLSANEGSPVVADYIQLTAIISPINATGTVTFKDSGATLGTAIVNNGSASFAISSIAAGTHVYMAVYSGDGTYLTNSSNSLTLTTQAAPPSTSYPGSTNSTGTTVSQQVAVPAYFYPPTYWSQLVGPVGFAVANVANGPNYGVDSNYAAAIAASHKSGTKVLGYVDTGYFGGTNPARTTRLNQTDVNSWTTQIEQDVDAWYSLYGANGIDGIFFDDGQNVCGANNQYVTLYTDIYNYVKRNYPGAYVVTNPGVAVPQCLENTADTLLTFEGSYDCYINDSSCAAGQGYVPLDWSPVDPRKQFHIVYAIPNASLANASALTKKNNAGLVFLTSATLAGNPYGSLPSFFAQELTDSAPGGGADMTIPTTPVVANVSEGGTSAIVSWAPSADANGSGVVGYDVYQNGVWATSVPASSSPQVALTGLLPSTTYNIYVKARNAAGTVSAASNKLAVTTSKAGGNITAPTLQNGVTNDTDVMLSWTASQANTYPLAYYDVFVNGVKTVTVDAGVTSADMIQLLGTLLTEINLGLPIKTSYSFTVQARDAQGDVSPMSNSVTATLPEAPTATACTVTSTSAAVTISCKYWAPWGFHHVYIDADNKANTGYQFSWTSPAPIGADYLIENTNLEAYAGNGTTFSWTQIATEEPVVTGSDSAGFTYTWTIPRSDFSGVSLGTTSLYLLNGTGYVPEAYSQVLTCSSTNCSSSQ